MREHPRRGYDALAAQGGFPPEMLDVVLHHHEFLDGTGYPDGLQRQSDQRHRAPDHDRRHLSRRWWRSGPTGCRSPTPSAFRSWKRWAASSTSICCRRSARWRSGIIEPVAPLRHVSRSDASIRAFQPLDASYRLLDHRHARCARSSTIAGREPMDLTLASGEVDIPADIVATLVDPAAYADHRIHDSYRWLRANNPLGVARPEKFDPFWVVTKHAHIQAISRQNELFHNADRPTTLTSTGGRGARPQDHRRAQSRALAGADGRARPSEIPRADTGLVHAGQPRKVRSRAFARSPAARWSGCWRGAASAISSPMWRSAIPCTSSWKSSACRNRTSRAC